MSERICVNCRHCQRIYADPHGPPLCARPIGTVHSRVTGSSVRRLLARCEQERQGKRTIMGRAKCGPDGTFFEAGCYYLERRGPPPTCK